MRHSAGALVGSSGLPVGPSSVDLMAFAMGGQAACLRSTR